MTFELSVIYRIIYLNRNVQGPARMKGISLEYNFFTFAFVIYILTLRG